MDKLEAHPAIEQHLLSRTQDWQLRIADVITKFAGSMTFIYIHIMWFLIWIFSGIEKFPFGLLTMIVSLEAIFLSTFVMIGQNRQADVTAAKAAHDYEYQVKQLEFNTDLTKEIHSHIIGGDQGKTASS